MGRAFTADMTGDVVVPGFPVPHTATSLCRFPLGAVTGGRVATRHDPPAALTGIRCRAGAPGAGAVPPDGDGHQAAGGDGTR